MSWRFGLLTANVQSGIGKLSFLEQQFVGKDVHVAFLQEMKGREGLIKSRHYMRYDSESEGNWGCSVWISRTKPFADSGAAKHYIKETDVTVFAQSPRYMVLQVHTPATKIFFASVHWPAQTRPAEERATFARTFLGILERMDGFPCVIGMDANARVPTDSAGVTGAVGCGQPDEAGYALVSILQRHGFWMPSTYECCHVGRSETWTHATGKASRIDFPLLSRHFHEADVQTHVADDIDLLTTGDDHDPVMAVVKLVVTDGLSRPSMVDRVRKYDARKLAKPEVQAAVDYWLECMGLHLIPWELDVNSHAQAIQDGVERILCAVAPVDHNKPLSTYIPDEAWRIREARQALKKRTRHRKEAFRDHRLRQGFHCWLDKVRGGGHAAPVRLDADVVIYEVVAFAVKFATVRMRRLIHKEKNEQLLTLSRQVGSVTPDVIFNKLKTMQIGGRKPKRWKSALPKLRDCSGALVNGRLDLDRVWMQYFSDMELGELKSTEAFIQQTLQADFVQVDFNPDLALLPSLMEVEVVLRGTKAGKAAGLDKVPGELLKHCSRGMAATLHPLMLKAVLRGRQPVQWRGGLLIEAVKKAGLEAQLDGHRSLFVGSVVGKAYHRFVRSRLIDKTEATLRGTHYGVRRGSTVSQASQVAILFEVANADRRQSSAILFVDARSAYYRVIRQMVYGSNGMEEDAVILRIMEHFGLPADAWQDLLATMAGGGLLQAYGFTDHARHLARDLHDRSFFVTRHSTGRDVIETHLAWVEAWGVDC